MKRCPKCDGFHTVYLDDERKYCSLCGEELMNCPKCDCGRELGLGDNYCPYCGQKRK